MILWKYNAVAEPRLLRLFPSPLSTLNCLPGLSPLRFNFRRRRRQESKICCDKDKEMSLRFLTSFSLSTLNSQLSSIGPRGKAWTANPSNATPPRILSCRGDGLPFVADYDK